MRFWLPNKPNGEVYLYGSVGRVRFGTPVTCAATKLSSISFTTRLMYTPFPTDRVTAAYRTPITLHLLENIIIRRTCTGTEYMNAAVSSVLALNVFVVTSLTENEKGFLNC